MSMECLVLTGKSPLSESLIAGVGSVAHRQK